MNETEISVDQPLTLVVSSRRIEGQDVAVIEMRHPDGERLPDWAPGAHIAVCVGDVDQIREYSLCGSVDEKYVWTIGVRLVEGGRGGSSYVHSAIAEGSLVTVVRLGNLFRYAPVRRPVFIAAGIGITAVLPMIEHANSNGLDWNLLYLGRERSQMPFVDALIRFGDRVTVVESIANGRVDLGSHIRRNRGAHFYCCGPEEMLNEIEEATRRFDDVELSVERFTPRGPDADVENTEFDVIIDSTGERVPVRSDQSTLSALIDAGFRVMNSCGEGTCGSCETAVLKGTPDHRDSILSDAERELGDYMYVCVSRSKTPALVLDL